jgi:hypothetical protein
MKLNFEYSIDSEFNYVRGLANQADFFKGKHYRLKTPGNLSLEEISNLSDVELASLIQDEFDLDSSKKFSTELDTNFNSEKKKFENYFLGLAGEKIEVITVSWTNYGPGGSYGKPGYAKLRFEASVPMLVNFTDEITHSIIEVPVVRKYGLSHQEKEQIADYLVNKVIPKRGYSSFGKPSEDLLKKVGLE